MKKILLSSIIMLGVCGAVNAQTAAKTKKNDASTVSTGASVAPTPQKAALMPATTDAAPALRTAADKEAAAANPAPPTRIKNKPAQAKTAATTVNAAGVAVPSEEAKLQAVKNDDARATGANEKKNQQ